MSQATPTARATWLYQSGGLLLWLLLGLATFWQAHAQAISPFAVRVTPAGPIAATAPTPVLTAQAVAPPFPVGVGFDGPVYAVLVQPDGNILVGGSFTSYQGTTCHNIARLSPAGVLDATFATNTGGGAAYSSGMPGASVRALALLSNGQILVGGDFTQYAGLLRLYLVRLSATGVIDTGYGNVSGIQTSLNGTTTTAVAAGVHTLAVQMVQGSERVLVGGNFTSFSYGGTSTPIARNNLVRLTSNGILDTTDFADSGFDGPVFALLVQPTGIVVGGAFQNTMSAVTGSVAQNRVSRLTLAGAYTGFFGSVNFAYGSVKTLAAQTNGDIVVGGDFYVGAGTNPGIARLNASTGAIDPGFPGTVLTPLVGAGASVNVVVAQAGDTLLVGGNFSSTVIPYNHLVRLTSAGTPTSYAATNTGNSTFGTTVAQGINALAVQPDGKIVVGGAFTTYNGVASKSLSRLSRTATLDLTDTPLSGATYVWNNGSTGPSLTAVATGSYSATATVRGQSVVSPTVQVTRPSAAPTFSVRVTPTGPLRVCPGAPQVLTALAVPNGTSTLPGPISYQWQRVVGNTLTPVSSTATYAVPASAAGTVGYYVATATSGTMVAASPTLIVTAMPVPTVAFASGTTLSGVPGTVVRLVGTNLDAVTDVRFGPSTNSPTAVFTHTSATELRVVVPALVSSGATAVKVYTPCADATTSDSYRVAPSITSIAPPAGPAGTVLTVTGTGFDALIGVQFAAGSGTVAAPFAKLSGSQFTTTVPATASTGSLTVSSDNGTSSTSTIAFVVTSGSTTQVVAPATTLPLASYTNVEVTSGSTLNLTQNLSISGQLIVRSGATLNTGLFQVTGSGGLVMEAGATLTTAHAQGISASAATGGIVLTGTRRYASDATYAYTSTTAQITGDGLPSQVRNLRCANATSLTLTSPVAVAQLLTLASTGNFLLNNNMLTLLSGPGGTAVVYNQGTGVVVGAATAQRYIDPRVNPTAGFRYYGSPVRGATALQLPVPVFAFDQTRITASGRRDTTAAINYGFVPGPLQPGTVLEAGRGYRAAVPAAATVNFVGTLTTDTLSLRLVRSFAAPFSGWNLVSNPYPSPLDWSLVLPADRPGLEAAIYVYESTGPGTGYFRSYVNGVGTGSPLIAAGQAFFVRVSGTTAGGGTGRLRFRNTQRVTVFDNATQPVFNRAAQAQTGLLPELVLEFERNGGCGPCRPTGTSATQTPVPAELNSITVYTAPGATPGFDPLLDADAGNLFSPTQQTLGIRSAGPDTLAVQALAGFSATTTTEVPLTLSATAPGSYQFMASAVLLPTLLNGASLYLRDASVTPNRYTPLADGTVVTVTLTAAELLAQVRPTRFYLYFGPPKILATTSGAALQSATVYPNPAHERIGVQVPAVPGATQVQTTLLNTLGQVLLRHTAALPATGTTLSLPVPGLASGVYLLRLQAGDTLTTRRVVLD